MILQSPIRSLIVVLTAMANAIAGAARALIVLRAAHPHKIVTTFAATSGSV